MAPDRGDAEITDVAQFEAGALASVGLDNPAFRRATPARTSPTRSPAGTTPATTRYIWSEVLDADTVEWFRENGGLTRENGDRFRSLVLGVGGSVDPHEAYLHFRGRTADIQPLLDRRGLGA